jgi:hypothetical protein
METVVPLTHEQDVSMPPMSCALSVDGIGPGQQLVMTPPEDEPPLALEEPELPSHPSIVSVHPQPLIEGQGGPGCSAPPQQSHWSVPSKP